MKNIIRYFIKGDTKPPIEKDTNTLYLRKGDKLLIELNDEGKIVHTLIEDKDGKTETKRMTDRLFIERFSEQ